MERTVEFEKKIRDEIYEFFADQCSVDLEEIKDTTNIIEDIDGDSLIFLQLLQEWKTEYDIDLEFRVIGKYLTKNPVETIGDAVNLALLIICEREKFKELIEA